MTVDTAADRNGGLDRTQPEDVRDPEAKASSIASTMSHDCKRCLRERRASCSPSSSPSSFSTTTASARARRACRRAWPPVVWAKSSISAFRSAKWPPGRGDDFDLRRRRRHHIHSCTNDLGRHAGQACKGPDAERRGLVKADFRDGGNLVTSG